jgi:hypothetical protein
VSGGGPIPMIGASAPRLERNRRKNENDPGATWAPGPASGTPRTGPDYLMKRISEYFGSGQRSSGTILSRRSATSRARFIAGITFSCT